MGIEWLSLGSKGPSARMAQDARIGLVNTKGGYRLTVEITRGAWITKLHRADRIAVGFDSFNGVPTRMYFAMSESGYAVINRDKSNSTPRIYIQAAKLQRMYPKLKVSELQGDYKLSYDEEQKAAFISLGAKAY